MRRKVAKTIKRLFRRTEVQKETPGRLASAKEVKSITDQSIKELGPILKLLSNE